MAVKNSIAAIPMIGLASEVVSDTYAAINPLGTSNNCPVLKIINASTEDITISFNGTTDNDYATSMTTVVLPGEYFPQPQNLSSAFPKGTIVYVKGTAGTGSIYLAGYFNPNSIA
jgi:archaellum component FlaF (FlaF/FlaG flagellin family)